MKRTLSIAALCLLLGCLLFWARSQFMVEDLEEPSAVTISPEAPPEKSPVLKPSQLSTKELEHLATTFRNPHFTQSHVILPGETLVVGGFEGLPGEYIFAEVTPTLVRFDKVNEMLRLELSLRALNMAGEERILSPGLAPIHIPINQRGGRYEEENADGFYRMKFNAHADLKADPPLIQLDVGGHFSKEEERPEGW